MSVTSVCACSFRFFANSIPGRWYWMCSISSLFCKKSMFGSINLHHFLYGARGVAYVSLNMEMFPHFTLICKQGRCLDLLLLPMHCIVAFLSSLRYISINLVFFSCHCLFLEAQRPWLLWSVVNSAAENKGSDCIKISVSERHLF